MFNCLIACRNIVPSSSLMCFKHSISNTYLRHSRYYSRGDTPEKAVDMYISQNEWEAAHKVAMTCMKPEEIAVLYITHAQDMEGKGRYRDAEKLVFIRWSLLHWKVKSAQKPKKGQFQTKPHRDGENNMI